MANRKNNTPPEQTWHCLNSRARIKGDLDCKANMATPVTCAKSNDLERGEGTIVSDISALPSKSHQILLPAPNRAVTRDYKG